jgi:hexosaminidase
MSQVFDAPRFIWRGVLLDVGRHFFSVPFIMKLLDLMALYKMNRFHWHLTEDQVSL